MSSPLALVSFFYLFFILNNDCNSIHCIAKGQWPIDFWHEIIKISDLLHWTKVAN